MAPHRNARMAFTLIELLVVISIISLLISVLLPALGAARKSANATQCLSKLRQIGQSLIIYTQDYKQSLPPGTVSEAVAGAGNSTNWGVQVLNMMGAKGVTFSQQAANGNSLARSFLTDHDTIAPTASNSNPLHYSAHPRLMPDVSTSESSGSPYTGKRKPVTIDAIKNPSDLIMVYDGTQIAGGNSASVGLGLDADRIYYDTYLVWGVSGQPSDRARAGENRDAASWGDTNVGEIRYRHMNNSRANTVFVDGHAAAIKYNGNNGTDIFRKNMNVRF
ncbi:MAG: type II secretion system protein [Phycisphaeraceae bacterium JB051]